MKPQFRKSKTQAPARTPIAAPRVKTEDSTVPKLLATITALRVETAALRNQIKALQSELAEAKAAQATKTVIYKF